MTPVDLLGLVLLGSAASLALALLTGGLLAFGDERLDLEADELAKRGRLRRAHRPASGARWVG